MNSINNERSNRYERKFYINNFQLNEILSFIKMNPMLFLEIYHNRFVNNIYFDTHNFLLYHDNIIGNPYRKKVRIRWYDNFMGMIDPVLEIKYRNGDIGGKESFPLSKFKFNQDITIQKRNLGN